MGGDIKAFVRSEDVVSCELEGGSALLDLRSSTYFRLNETANFLWEQLGDASLSADELADRISQTYSVSKAECLPDVLAVLAELQDSKLVAVKP